MKRPVIPILISGALALALSGCRGGGEAGKPAPTPTAPPAQTAAPSPTPSARPPAPSPSPTPSPAPSTAAVGEPSPSPEAEGPGQTAAAAADGGWNSREAQVTFGMAAGEDLPLVVAAAQVEEDTLTVSLLPAGNEPAFAAFQEADLRLPHTQITYDAGAGALVLRLENTALSSGDVTGDDWVFDFIAEHGMTYPVATPAGAIGEDGPYFAKAAISSDGVNTTISLLLTDAAGSYRVVSGSHGGDEMLPYFRLEFREEGEE